MRVVHTLGVGDEGEVGAARRAVHRFAAALGFGEQALAELDIVVQEIGTNAVRYAQPGGCLFWTTPLDGPAGVEIIYWDQGPGIYDVDRALRDGVSSSGSLGGGLGASQRLLDEFDLYSTMRGQTARLNASRRTTHGTAILGRKRLPTEHESAADSAATMPARRVGAWSRCRKREDVNGDAYYVGHHGAATLYAVVDGLGHGYGARDASAAALDTLARWRGEPPDELIRAAHDALRSTRGAVMGACVVDEAAGTFEYAGVGNIDVRVFNAPEPVRPVPNNGTVGLRLSSVRRWRHSWARGATLILASDGLSASWDVLSYPGLLRRDVQLIAAVLLRDFGRDSDDATVLVAR